MREDGKPASALHATECAARCCGDPDHLLSGYLGKSE